MRRIHHLSSVSLLLALVVTAAGCEQSPAAPVADDHLSAHIDHQAAAERGAARAHAAHGDLLKAVRQSTALFHASRQALRAGYEADAHCVAHPELGGMGMHWVNGALIDPVFDPFEPEVLLYAPRDGNNPELIGVEYIVIDVGQPKPYFDGHPFDDGGVPPLEAAGVPHWSLHVWAHKDNPSGTFAPFNPDVSCD